MARDRDRGRQLNFGDYVQSRRIDVLVRLFLVQWLVASLGMDGYSGGGEDACAADSGRPRLQHDGSGRHGRDRLPNAQDQLSATYVIGDLLLKPNAKGSRSIRE